MFPVISVLQGGEGGEERGELEAEGRREKGGKRRGREGKRGEREGEGREGKDAKVRKRKGGEGREEIQPNMIAA